ncbi:transcription factor NIGT1-like isoform X3 [Zingiber officinale]|uniref:transcription factor NIGT1-like isoform X3 n=1 Tax=Zingiber officinale TaxID=94328 RepID=UPI001C4C49BA|nr:transcription factor NIGT1-like isoform X3 [Zingiber officinale]
MNKANDYVRALEEERKKIQVFRRELPLCMQLVTQAIESFRQRMDDRPVLEEFIPLKPSSSSSSKERFTDAQKSTPPPATGSSEKLDWLKSVQLWNQSAETEVEPPPPPPMKPIAVGANGGAFHPFVRENKVAAAASSNASKGDVCGGGGDGGSDDKKEGQPQSQSHKKTRRCWSPELHRRFLHALEQLGGAQVATPKQIKELMKVDGLTNDEVKSHLQKYRLYHQRQSPEAKGTDSIHHVPQFVLMRGVWVPPQDSPAAVEIAGSGSPAPRVYTPVATLASDLRFKQQKPSMAQTRGKNNDDDDDDGASNSSSSQTTTASPQRRYPFTWYEMEWTAWRRMEANDSILSYHIMTKISNNWLLFRIIFGLCCLLSFVYASCWNNVVANAYRQTLLNLGI